MKEKRQDNFKRFFSEKGSAPHYFDIPNELYLGNKEDKGLLVSNTLNNKKGN